MTELKMMRNQFTRCLVVHTCRTILQVEAKIETDTGLKNGTFSKLTISVNMLNALPYSSLLIFEISSVQVSVDKVIENCIPIIPEHKRLSSLCS